jgi:hypothetical protein
MRIITSSIALFAAAVSVSSAISMARAQNVCDQLWVERNDIYKAYGYCFKTARAISYFGNDGCVYQREGDISITREDRIRIGQIIAQERANGCR